MRTLYFGVALVGVISLSCSYATSVRSSSPVKTELGGEDFLDGFLGQLERELKAELRELREKPEMPYLPPYAGSEVQALKLNTSDLQQMMAVAKMHVKSQDNVVHALEEALARAEKDKYENQVKVERAEKLLKESSSKAQELQAALQTLGVKNMTKAQEREATYNVSLQIANHEYLRTVEGAKFDMEDKLEKNRIDYETARKRVDYRIAELRDEWAGIVHEKERLGKQFKGAPTHENLDRIQNSVDILKEQFKAETAKKSKLEKEAKIASLKEGELSEDQEKILKELE